MRTWFRPDIEGLRALAVLLVVANHAWGFPTGGYVGVDIFFVISGYLITRALLREKEEKGAISLGRFYTRRFARLAPAAIATIAVTVAMSNLLFFGATNASWNQQALSSLLWVQNWNLVHSGTVYLDANASVSPFQHFWSLSVEEQFYAFWPWALILAWLAVAAVAKRRAPRLRGTVLVVGILGFVGSLAFSIWLTDSRPASAYFATPTRIWEFAAGVILAAGFAGVSRRAPATALRAAGLVAILVSAVLFDTTTPFPGAAALLPVLGTAAVIVAAERATTDRDYGRALTLAPVRYIGRISYSLYLWHAPVIIFAAALFPGEGFLHGLLCVAVSVAIAALSYHVIEQPARQAAVWKRLGAWLSKRGNVARVGGFAVTALLVAVLSVGQLRGVELLPKPAPATTAPAAWSSPEELAAALAESSAGDSWKPFSAELSGPLQPVDFQGCLRDAVAPGDHSRLREPCVLSGDGGRRTAYVVGDSIALSWVPALRSALGSGWDVAELGLQGCPAASTRVGEVRDRATFTDDCERMRESDLAAVAAAKPDLIVFASALGPYKTLESGKTGAPAQAEWTSATLRSMEAVRSVGAPVVVIGNPPEGRRVTDCVLRIFGPDRCASTIDAVDREKRAAEVEAVRQATAQGLPAVYLDPEPWFCTSDGSCPIGVGDVIVRLDSSHLTQSSSESLGGVLRSALVAARVV